jgi:arylsulfatase A-like enzyme
VTPRFVAKSVAIASLASAALGCPKKTEPSAASVNEPASTHKGGTAANGAPGAKEAVVLDFIGRFDDCALGHYGPLLDLGDPTSRAAYGTRVRTATPESVEREGANWAKITLRTITLSFVLDQPPEAYTESVVSARIRGGSARSVSVWLNDKPVGLWNLAKGEVRNVEARTSGGLLVPGANVITLRFNGAGRMSADDLAEIDWIHVGSTESNGPYAAPTRADVLANASLGGIAKRALSLRAPAYARAGGVLPSGARFEAYLGLAGATDGEVEVQLLRDRLPAVTLATFRLGAADSSAWKPVRVPLGDVGDKPTLGALMLVAKSVTKGGRVLLGEPRVVVGGARPEAPVTTPASRGVLLVVLGDVSPRGLAIYGGPKSLPELGTFASTAVLFDAQRATTTVPPGAVASMLTGLEARAHGVSDYDTKLADKVTTLAGAVRQGGVVAAMFTANPLTGAAFGFDRAWETFEMQPPGAEGPATRVFDRAAAWIDAHKSERFLVVVHARGGHPPWDVPPERLKSLVPEGYTGGIDPQHAAELLAKARRVPPVLRYSEQDRERTWALYDAALAEHDAALGRLLSALKAAGRDADTTVIVTSDVSVDEAAHVPFGDGETLDEAELRVPLIVRAATDAQGPKVTGKHIVVPTSGIDVARSIMNSLGLAPPSSFGGVDLWETATSSGDQARPLLATLSDAFALRWGSFLLTGAPKKEPTLCNLLLEPVCTTDVRATHPLAAEAIQRQAVDTLASLPAAPPRESPSIDAATAAALRAWGR